jgi:hypothetical protein
MQVKENYYKSKETYYTSKRDLLCTYVCMYENREYIYVKELLPTSSLAYTQKERETHTRMYV